MAAAAAGPKLVAVTELAWLDDSPPGEVREFWREGYPAMATVDENRRRAERAGFEVFDSFVLPTRCWWDEYLTPLAARAAALRPAAVSDAALAAVLDEAAREEDVVRRFGAHFGYVFFLMRAA